MTPPPSPRRVELADWLSTVHKRSDRRIRPLVLGGTGHLLLSRLEEDNVVQHLERGLLPRLVSMDGSANLTLLTGLAPGADLLLTRTVMRWLSKRGVPHELVGLLPVPEEVLIQDWSEKAHAAGAPRDEARTEATWQELRQVMAECRVLVELVPDAGTRSRLDDPTVRQVQYRRLAAILVEQTDILIAILRDQSLELPGGTAEVVEWRRHPNLVPREFSTLSLEQRVAVDIRRQLIVLDPAVPYHSGGASVPDAADAALKQAREALNAGNYLRCHDIIARARGRGADSRALQYLAVLALANAGSARLALRRYGEFEQTGALDEDWLALKGRLLKDLAFRGGADAPYLFVQSAEAYEAAYLSTGGSFSGINAASMYCLGGKPEVARMLAAQILELLRRGAPASDEDQYYWQVTQAEASLLLGDLDACGASLRAANLRQIGNVNARSRTRFQLRQLARHTGRGDKLIDALELPPVIYAERLAGAPDDLAAWSGQQSKMLEELARAKPPVFLGLIGLPELRVAEICLEQGVPLYLSLPGERAAEVRRWRKQHGEDVAERYARCLMCAHEVSMARGFIEGEEKWCARYVESMACGLSALAARRLATERRLLRIAVKDGNVMLAWGTEEPSPRVERAAQLPHEATQQLAALNRRYVGLIFADFVGFSALPDDVLPRYWNEVMGAMGETLNADRDRILFRHTWGDALHIVTADALSAAVVATNVRATLEQLRARLGGELARLELRLSLHYAPVFIGHDPIEEAATYYGTQLSFAARVEPVTPPGVIFVTESFAARVMLEAPEQFVLEYAGELELAKNFGKYRLFSLRKAG